MEEKQKETVEKIGSIKEHLALLPCCHFHMPAQTPSTVLWPCVQDVL